MKKRLLLSNIIFLSVFLVGTAFSDEWYDKSANASVNANQKVLATLTQAQADIKALNAKKNSAQTRKAKLTVINDMQSFVRTLDNNISLAEKSHAQSKQYLRKSLAAGEIKQDGKLHRLMVDRIAEMDAKFVGVNKGVRQMKNVISQTAKQLQAIVNQMPAGKKTPSAKKKKQLPAKKLPAAKFCTGTKISYQTKGPLNQFLLGAVRRKGIVLAGPNQDQLGAQLGGAGTPIPFTKISFVTVYDLAPGSDWSLCKYKQRAKGFMEVFGIGAHETLGVIPKGALPDGRRSAYPGPIDASGRIWDPMGGQDIRKNVPRNITADTKTRVVFYDRPGGASVSGILLSFESILISSNGSTLTNHIFVAGKASGTSKVVPNSKYYPAILPAKKGTHAATAGF